jgi:hypothetical protein
MVARRVSNPRVLSLAQRLFRGPAISLASQITGLAQIALLLSHGGATGATDTYFYLFSLGLTPTLILVQGLMYPLLLNETKISQNGLRRIRKGTPLLAFGFILVGCGWLALRGRLHGEQLPLAILIAANTVLQARLFFRAVAAEASGNPLWISGIALPANLTACVMLLLPWRSSLAATTAMLVALVVGNTALLVVVARRAVGRAVLESCPVQSAPRAGSLWFLGKASIGYVSQIVLSSLAVLLPASGVTFLGLATKLVGATSTTFTNAILPNFVHQLTSTDASGRRFLRVLVVTLAVTGAVGVVVVAVVRPEETWTATIIAAWLVTSSAAAVAVRMSFRFLPASAAGVTIVAVVVVVIAAVLASNRPGFDLNILLSAYGAVDGVTAALLLWRLKDQVMTVAIGAVLLLLLVCVSGQVNG